VLRIGGSSESLTTCIQHLTDATAVDASGANGVSASNSNDDTTTSAITTTAPPTLAWLDSKRLLAWALYEVSIIIPVLMTAIDS
jgi:hypothetical protein